MTLSFDLIDLAKHHGFFLALAGVSAHLLYWIRGERNNKEVRAWLLTHAVVNIAILGFILLNPPAQQSPWSISAWGRGLAAVSLLNLCFYGPLFASVSVYRLFFHRLRRFPGPVALKLSKLTAAYANVGKERDFERIWDLHKQYGDIVRTGPQELSVLSADAIEAIYGASSRCTRATWYDRLKASGDFSEDFATFHIRDPVAHGKRRKALWDKAFNIRALKSYQPVVVRTTERFLDALQERVGQVVSGPDTMQLLSYDLMGLVGWGYSFENIENWRLNPALHFVRQVTSGQRIISQAPWLMSLLVNLPGMDAPMHRYGNWIEARIREKMQLLQGPERETADAMGKMIPAMVTLSESALYSEGELMVIAGGDTTATTLATVIFYLARNPSIQHKLQAELDEAAQRLRQQGDDEATDSSPEASYYRSISSLPYLRACINEALRLMPPVPGEIPRKTPLEGIHIPLPTPTTPSSTSVATPSTIFIPGDTIISVPVLPVQRDSRNYVHPDDFIPERWTDEKPELTLNRSAFMPFAAGAYTCAGRALAYIEMRIVLAKLFERFQVRLADGEDGRRFLEETKDCHVVHLGDFEVVYERRG
ncbi:cytochrome P450 [Aspergillus saccharolyticus JOP 1030-1]|uniref:Cytochrome P450 n=1 Tax=Aspergillus saccharolyticus JOP 1030-1 TaxID=1450539 RepID=A0A318Z0H5_9EURO|nr:cytochrome P450 [Aspergillus saccharolyticus JOP 1030-1]PYH40506.1 cytochrome P450 [Aspergillus saccharolyticus JOP 1030-1]